MSDKSEPQARWYRRLRRSPWGPTIVAIGVILTTP